MIQLIGATLALMEIVLTAALVGVIRGTASAAQNVGAIAALGFGGYIAPAGLRIRAGQRHLDDRSPLFLARRW